MYSRLICIIHTIVSSIVLLPCAHAQEVKAIHYWFCHHHFCLLSTQKIVRFRDFDDLLSDQSCQDVEIDKKCNKSWLLSGLVKTINATNRAF